jgi:hypothetical protein
MASTPSVQSAPHTQRYFFPGSTCVFSSPEDTERVFENVRGAVQPAQDEAVGLMYPRLNHPRPGILE